MAYGVVLMLVMYLGVWFWLRETAAGRHVYAVGNNPEATRFTGIATERVLLGVYVLAGVFYGIAALLSVSRTGVGDPNAGQTENLDAITAVVLGGTSLFGGRGAVLGSLVGALIVHMVGVRIYPRPTWVGKAATFFQILTVLAGLGARWFQLPLSPKPIVWVAAVFTVVSGLQYIVQGMRFLNTAHTAEHEEHESTLFRG